MATIMMVGAFDTKGVEYAFLREQILARGHEVLAVNTGVMGECEAFAVDVDASEVAAAAGASLESLRAAGDRGAAMKAMGEGAAKVAEQGYAEGRFDGIVGMGGSGGSSVVTAAMRALPVGVPKVCVSTVAAGDTGAYVGSKDVVLIPSIVDVAGVNRISRVIFTRAAGAICGMVEAEPAPAGDDKPIVVASMFGNTTECVNACSETLSASGYEVLVFHATGTGGRTMESLIDEGLVDAVLDITTTEWADEVCGGVFSAGPDRLSAAGRGGFASASGPRLRGYGQFWRHGYGAATVQGRHAAFSRVEPRGDLDAHQCRGECADGPDIRRQAQRRPRTGRCAHSAQGRVDPRWRWRAVLRPRSRPRF